MIVQREFAESLAEQLRRGYHNLHVLPEQSKCGLVVRGTFPVSHNGKEFDHFQIMMTIPYHFPKEWPKVWEIGGRIPHVQDRHINPADGTACILLPDEAYRTLPRSITVLEYLNGPVKDFFVSQSVFEHQGEWPWGDRSHGAHGIVEFYGELLRTDDILVVEAFLKVLATSQIKGYLLCPCGSRKKIRRCHQGQIHKLRNKIPKQTLETSLGDVRRLIEKQNENAPQ